MSPKKLLSTRQAASRLGFSSGKIPAPTRALMKTKGIVPVVQFGGKGGTRYDLWEPREIREFKEMYQDTLLAHPQKQEMRSPVVRTQIREYVLANYAMLRCLIHELLTRDPDQVVADYFDKDQEKKEEEENADTTENR